MKYKQIIPLIVAIIALTTPYISKAVDVSLKPTLTSRHYWRGIMVSKSVNIETDLQFQWNRFQFGIYGGYGLQKNTYSEFDLHMSYRLGRNLTISIWDLYASRDRNSIDDYDYMDWDQATTNHLINADLHYKVGHSPLSIMWSTLLWGRDLDAEGNQNYSSYLEATYGMYAGDSKLTFFVGANMFDDGLYADRTAIVNVGVGCQNHIQLTEKKQLPVWAKVVLNPEVKQANLIFGLGF
ncbi:hypothetical protein OAT16_11120 [Prolixibacteraceae bacterium]|nr:hypothetical protein [Prolixibacteraceae bacterium]